MMHLEDNGQVQFETTGLIDLCTLCHFQEPGFVPVLVAKLAMFLLVLLLLPVLDPL